MSGGSYNYLFLADTIEELAKRCEDLDRMAERLGGLPWATGAASETYRLVSVLRRLDARLAAAADLRDVWHAVEWWDSSDWSEDQARKAARVFEDVL